MFAMPNHAMTCLPYFTIPNDATTCVPYFGRPHIYIHMCVCVFIYIYTNSIKQSQELTCEMLARGPRGPTHPEGTPLWGRQWGSLPIYAMTAQVWEDLIWSNARILLVQRINRRGGLFENGSPITDLQVPCLNRTTPPHTMHAENMQKVFPYMR